MAISSRAAVPYDQTYTGFADGRIIAFDGEGNHRELANTGGRPL